MLPVFRDDKQIGEFKFTVCPWHIRNNGILKAWVMSKIKRNLPALTGIRYDYSGGGRYRVAGVLVA